MNLAICQPHVLRAAIPEGTSVDEPAIYLVAVSRTTFELVTNCRAAKEYCDTLAGLPQVP